MLKRQDNYLLSSQLLLGGDSSLRVGESNVEFLCSLHDFCSLSSAQVAGKFSSVNSVVHHEEFEFGFVSDQELLQTVWTIESTVNLCFSLENKRSVTLPGLLGSAVTDGDKWSVSSELSSHSVINTSWSSPVGLQSEVLIAVESAKLGGSLVDLLGLENRLDSHLIDFIMITDLI